MKFIVLGMLVMCLLFPTLAKSGEKEDLELQGKYLMEKERRIQMEWNFFQQEKKDFDLLLKVYGEKEKAKSKVEQPKPPEKK